MSTYITKQIPVSSHVKKYLEYNFGKSYTFSQNNFLGQIIINVFRKGYRKQVVVKCDDSYTVKLKQYQIDVIGNLLEWEDCIVLNKAIDTFFRTQIFFHMDMNRKLDKDNSYPAMVQCLVEMNITESDIKYDTLYRDYKRKCVYPKTTKKKIDFEEEYVGMQSA
ncbi:hypothetical protein [Aquimarina aggregata]|uniref:hypothetical protein n=1 Tax=Aquimarina aggregata TaxID=1642818 RepID=UPI002490D079|nr:hypothetical protein [Aquimarina aggregata]